MNLSEIGIILLLFSIGLKVKIKKLLEPHIWGTASLHMIIASPAVNLSSQLYGRWNFFLRRFETKKRLPGDASDDDFWQRGITSTHQITLGLLTMSHRANIG